MYIKAYSECMAYSGIFRTGDIFSEFLAHYLGIAQEQFMHILNLIFADPGIFRTLAHLDTECFTHIQAYSAPSNTSYTCNTCNILCKTKNFQIWNQKCLICVISGFKFENLLPYLKSAPTD